MLATVPIAIGSTDSVDFLAAKFKYGMNRINLPFGNDPLKLSANLTPSDQRNLWRTKLHCNTNSYAKILNPFYWHKIRPENSIFLEHQTAGMRLLFCFIWICLFSASIQAQGTAKGAAVNLGSAVNSPAGEIAPLISADGNTLYFIRDGDPQNKAGQDIWYSTRGRDGSWLPSIKAGFPLNQGKNSGVLNVSADGNQLMIKGAYVNGEFESAGLSVVTKARKGWSEPEKLEIKNFENYSKLGKYYGAFLCSDGKTLLFYFSDNTNKGLGDLYVSHLVRKNKDTKGLKNTSPFSHSQWTEPKKMGTINTREFDEMSPFMAADGVTLYFSSNRTGSFGSNDIWKSKRLDDSWEKWSTPVNLGNHINTSEWDGYYSLDAKGEEAYMVSWKNSLGAADIVKIDLSAENRPDPVVLVSGQVFNTLTKEPVGEVKIEYENLQNGEIAGYTVSSTETGSYTIVLPYGKNYGVLALANGFISVSGNLDLTQVAEYKEVKMDLHLAPLAVGSTIRLNNIFFDFGKASLRNESFPELDRLVQYMMQNGEMEIEVSGHTDNVGSDDVNLQLSGERAMAVAAYLSSQGIKAARIKAKGYGEEKPIASNDTEEGRQLNRRVEFTILKN
jgi:outer membrane protein OmpA-like peptidoglycan-associated protein